MPSDRAVNCTPAVGEDTLSDGRGLLNVVGADVRAESAGESRRWEQGVIEMRSRDIIIGRHGESITGRVLDKKFDISSVIGEMAVKTGSITWIHFMNPPQFRQDEIWLKNDDRLTGRIKQDVVLFELADGTRRRVPRDAVHTIVFRQTSGGIKMDLT